MNLAITFWSIVVIVAIAVLLCAVNEFAKVVSEKRKRAFGMKIAKIERKLKEKNNG